MTSYKLNIINLDCAHCASKIEEKLKTLPEYKNVKLDFLNKILKLDTDINKDNLISGLETIISKIETGVTLSFNDDNVTKKNYTPIRIIISLILLVINSLIFKLDIIVVLAYFIIGYDVILKSTKNISNGNVFDEFFLMSIATLGALCIKEYNEACFVMLFYQTGELLQGYAVNKSRKSIKELMDIKPEYANVIRNDNIITVDPSTVMIQEHIIVKPGEKIPLDGIVYSGESMIDAKALTGESQLVHVSKDSKVISGSINLEGYLEIITTTTYKDSTVSKILELVENASENKAKSETFITKFSKYYTPIVCLLALLIVIIPTILLSYNFNDQLYKGLSFLVVSCPCALVISIPLSYFAGIGGLSKKGILVKGSNYVETLSNIDTILFDKTNTLTNGEFKVIDVLGDNNLLEYAASIEAYSNHPIATSIVKHYNKETKEVIDYKEISGKGVIGYIDNKLMIAGNYKLLKEYNIDINIDNNIIYTTVYFAYDSKYLGYITLGDTLKEDTSKSIQNIKKLGINKLIMLTGDKKEISETIAKELQLSNVHSGLLPNDKVSITKDYITNKHNVAFVGDGINDAPVLALSNVGISMGLGSDAAIEASDIVLMKSNITSLYEAIKGCRKIQNIAKSNIIFAIGIKILALILIATGNFTMWMAVFADVGVTIIAIINSLRGLKL